jgi:hypothetical protein
MELFEEVFNPGSIYDMLFFNTKAVLIYPTLEELQKENPTLYDRWKYLSKSKYNLDMDTYHGTAGAMLDETLKYAQISYEEKAIFYPEFSRIVAITYGTVRSENGLPKRYLKKIANEDEFLTIATFMDILYGVSSEAIQSTPPYFPILCGHNIMNYDIPLLIKRFLIHKEKFRTLRNQNSPNELNNLLPLILKKVLSAKPWEGKVVDTVNVWKFNGFEYTSLMLISDYLGLKKTVDLLSNNELSKYYWDNVKEKPKETLEFVSLQSATQTNLVIQLLNLLRQI